MGTFDKMAETYEGWFQKNNLIFKSELDAIKDIASDLSGDKIEIGVGTGNFAIALGIADGVEPSLEMGKIATSKGINVITNSAEEFTIDKQYDVAFMITVDCFLTDICKAFLNIKKAIKSDGHLIMAFLNIDSTFGKKWYSEKKNHPAYIDAKFNMYTKISNQLKECGYEIVDTRQTIFKFENEYQQHKSGVDDGLFCVLKARIKSEE